MKICRMNPDLFVYLLIYPFVFKVGPQSSQLAEPLWTDPGLKSGISVRELIRAFPGELCVSSFSPMGSYTMPGQHGQRAPTSQGQGCTRGQL